MAVNYLSIFVVFLRIYQIFRPIIQFLCKIRKNNLVGYIEISTFATYTNQTTLHKHFVSVSRNFIFVEPSVLYAQSIGCSVNPFIYLTVQSLFGRNGSQSLSFPYSTVLPIRAFEIS